MKSQDYEERSPFAFPGQIKTSDGYLMTSVGMALRDYFAAKALQGMLADGARPTISEAASDAYRYADAMMKAREAKEAPPAPRSHPEAGD